MKADTARIVAQENAAKKAAEHFKHLHKNALNEIEKAAREGKFSATVEYSYYKEGVFLLIEELQAMGFKAYISEQKINRSDKNVVVSWKPDEEVKRDTHERLRMFCVACLCLIPSLAIVSVILWTYFFGDLR